MIPVTEAIYSDLRHAAGRLFTRERPGNPLQPEALVHEAWLRLASVDEGYWKEPAHFRSVAILQMRRVLIDENRRPSARRETQLRHAHHLHAAMAFEYSELREALARLRRVSKEAALVVELRFFAGMSHGEIALALRCSARTVRRQWVFARKWLARHLTSPMAALIRP